MEPKDILFIVLSVCAAILTGFFVWLLYYLIAILRDLRETTKLLHEKVEQVGGILESIKERISESVSVLSLLTTIISKVADGIRNRRTRQTKNSVPSDR